MGTEDSICALQTDRLKFKFEDVPGGPVVKTSPFGRGNQDGEHM